MDITSLLMLGLATWRTASLLTHEDGPFHVFMKIREKVGITHDENGKVFIVPDTFLAGVFSCVWCSSIWIGLGLTGLWIFFPVPTIYFSAWMAISAVAISVDRLVNR